MKLIQITAQNFKGQTFTEDLTSLNFLIGSNFAGKTTRTDAIRLLLLGYLPELGKPAKETFALASGTTLAVTGRFDNGMTISRSWTAKGKSISTDEQIPEEFKKLGDLAVMLNAEEYFALGDRGRVEYVARLVNLGSTYTTASIVDRLKAKLGPTDKPAPIFGRLMTADADGNHPDIQTVVGLMLIACTEAYKEAKDTAERMEKTVQGLATLRAQDAQLRPVAAIVADINKAREELGTMQTDRGTFQGAYDTLLKARNRRGEIQREISRSAQAVASVENINKTLEADRARLATMPQPDPQDLQTMRAEHLKHNSTITETATLLAGARATIAKCEREMADLENHKNCPFCGANATGWQQKVKDDIFTRQFEAQDVIKRESERNDIAAAAIIQLREKAAWHKEQQAAHDALAQSIASRERELATYQPLLGRQQALQEEADRLPAEDPKVETAVQMLTTQINLKQQDIRALETEQRTADTRASEISRLAKAEQQRDEARIEQKQAETCGKELKVLQAEMVAAAFGPILATANAFFEGILRTPLAYHDGEIGTFRDGIWVAHHTFSGTEKALTYAAIQAALTSQSPCRVMILDELGRLDDRNASLLVVRLLRLIEENTIDTFIGIDTGRPGLYQVAADSDGREQITVRGFE